MILREKDKIQLINIATQTIKTPSQIWAFGSRVNGDAHDKYQIKKNPKRGIEIAEKEIWQLNI
jgi:hypothetical protein